MENNVTKKDLATLTLEEWEAREAAVEDAAEEKVEATLSGVPAEFLWALYVWLAYRVMNLYTAWAKKKNGASSATTKIDAFKKALDIVDRRARGSASDKELEEAQGLVRELLRGAGFGIDAPAQAAKNALCALEYACEFNELNNKLEKERVWRIRDEWRRPYAEEAAVDLLAKASARRASEKRYAEAEASGKLPGETKASAGRAAGAARKASRKKNRNLLRGARMALVEAVKAGRLSLGTPISEWPEFGWPQPEQPAPTRRQKPSLPEVACLPEDLPLGEDEYEVDFRGAVRMECEHAKSVFKHVYGSWPRELEERAHELCDGADAPGKRVMMLAKFADRGSSINAEDAIVIMARRGYRPATYSETVALLMTRPEIMKARRLVVLGTVAKCRYGDRSNSKKSLLCYSDLLYGGGRLLDFEAWGNRVFAGALDCAIFVRNTRPTK